MLDVQLLTICAHGATDIVDATDMPSPARSMLAVPAVPMIAATDVMLETTTGGLTMRHCS